MSAVHDLAKSQSRPTVEQIVAAIAADLAFMESEFRTEGQKLSMSDAMPALIRALAKKSFTGDEADIIDATFAVMDTERHVGPDEDDPRYIHAVEDFSAVSERFIGRHIQALSAEGFDL